MAVLMTKKNKLVSIVKRNNKVKEEALYNRFFTHALFGDCNSLDFKHDIAPYIELGIIGSGNLWDTSIPGALISDFNKRELEEFGYGAKEEKDGVTVFVKNEDKAIKYDLYDTEIAIYLAKMRIEAIQFMASLYLASHYSNNSKVSSPLFDFKQGKNSARASFYLPEALSDVFTNTKGITCLSHVLIEDKICTATFKPFSVRVFGEDHIQTPDDWQAAFCSAVLLSIANSDFSFSLTTNYKLFYNRHRDVTTQFAYELFTGKVKPCPQCGAPVYHSRDNASPFCPGSKTNREHKSKSHYAQYYNAAKKMLKKSASIEDVIKAFPAIPESTIRKWNAKR